MRLWFQEKIALLGRFFLWYTYGMHPQMTAFLILATCFAVTHSVAMAGSFYWYYWWFDIFMHFWGGLLIGLGVHAMTTLKLVPLRPTLSLVALAIAGAVVSWEVFEYYFKLHGTDSYVSDTALDVALGVVGGLLAHSLLVRRTMA